MEGPVRRRFQPNGTRAPEIITGGADKIDIITGDDAGGHTMEIRGRGHA